MVLIQVVTMCRHSRSLPDPKGVFKTIKIVLKLDVALFCAAELDNNAPRRRAHRRAGQVRIGTLDVAGEPGCCCGKVVSADDDADASCQRECGFYPHQSDFISMHLTDTKYTMAMCT